MLRGTGGRGAVGLSWFIDERGGVPIAGHGGATVAHMSLLLLVPAHPAAYGRIDAVLGHERRYRKRELGARLQAAGFEVARLRHVNPVGIAGWFVTSRLLRAEQMPSGPLRLHDRLVPVLRLIDRLPVPFGLSLWAVARRPG